MTLQDLIDYASEKGFDPRECVIKAETFNNAHIYDVVQDVDEVFEPRIVLGFYPEKSTIAQEKRKLLIVADYNDADYVKDVIYIENNVFEKFLPLIKAINNFEPYVCKYMLGHICTHNWISSREDLGEKNIYETYPQFSKEYIDEFIDIFTRGLYTPYDDCTCHTIVEISDVVTGEKYVEWKQDHSSIEKRYNSKVKEYLKRRTEICNYTRPSDGKPLYSIPYSEMNEYENELIKELHNLWKDYQ